MHFHHALTSTTQDRNTLEVKAEEKCSLSLTSAGTESDFSNTADPS